jgi:hypothetical protein
MSLNAMSLFCCYQKQIVEVMQCHPVCHQATVNHELHVFTKSHRIGLRLGEVSPQLSEAGFVALFKDNRIVLRLRHLNLYNSVNVKQSSQIKKSAKLLYSYSLIYFFSKQFH